MWLLERTSTWPWTVLRPLHKRPPPLMRPSPGMFWVPNHSKLRASARAVHTLPLADSPATLVRAGSKHGPGLIVLLIIPCTAFCLGTWQIHRLRWKNALIAKYETRILKDPLPLPPYIDPDVVPDFDFRRITVSGVFRHDQEMLIGPRMNDGHEGYLLVTPLDRGPNAAKVLICQGWIAKRFKQQDTRRDGLPTGFIQVQGLLRKPWEKNYFTPDNKPESGDFFFRDVHQMASLTGCDPVWVDATSDLDLPRSYDFESRGIPLGRAAKVDLSNNHAQYIFTCLRPLPWDSVSKVRAVCSYFYNVLDGRTEASISKYRARAPEPRMVERA